MAIGIESNILQAKDPRKWEEYKDLHRAVYQELKAAHPNLPVFFTVEMLHLKGLKDKVDAARQQAEVRSLWARATPSP